MAKGHLYLVLAVLLGAGPVLAINVDLREQELQTQQELNLAVSRELGDVVDQAELISIKELNVSRVDSRGKKEKKNCKANGGWCKIKCDYQEAPFRCSRTHRCCLPPRSCVFGGQAWPHNSYLTEACIELLCKDGTWEYTGNINPSCGECNIEADPHIHPFDPFLNQPTPGYPLTSIPAGEYVFTQPGFAVPAQFGVKGHVEDCTYLLPTYAGSCITKVTYYEPGISVKLVLPTPGPIAAACVDYHDPPNIFVSAQDCDIKVLVNEGDDDRDEISISPFDSSVHTVNGIIDGPILVFKHDHINKDSKNLNCMSIVGTKGISISLCEYQGNYPYLYIWAMEDLKSPPVPPPGSTSLWGLCNTYTGNPAQDIGYKDGTVVPVGACWDHVSQTMSLCTGPAEFPLSWKYS